MCLGKKLNFKKEIHNTSHDTGLFMCASKNGIVSNNWKPHVNFLSQEVKIKLSFLRNLYISLGRRVRTTVIRRENISGKGVWGWGCVCLFVCFLKSIILGLL